MQAQCGRRSDDARLAGTRRLTELEGSRCQCNSEGSSEVRSALAEVEARPREFGTAAAWGGELHAQSGEFVTPLAHQAISVASQHDPTSFHERLRQAHAELTGESASALRVLAAGLVLAFRLRMTRPFVDTTVAVY